MATIIQKPATQIERRTYFTGISTPNGGDPVIEILREEIDGTKTTQLGVKKRIAWQELKTTTQFATFKTSLGITDGDAFFVALRDLFDNLCEQP
jgi:hypothetical protein